MQIIQSTFNSSSFNLAAEEFLFSECQNELLFLYVNEPSVIIGCNQVIRNEVNIEYCKKNNIRIMRRMSGGGAVYHDFGNINYCFISDKKVGTSTLSADFLLPVVVVLHELEIPVEIGKRKDLWLPGGFKISGTASHIRKNRELHHGTILYDADLENLYNSLTVIEKDNNLKGISSVPSQVKNVRTYIDEKSDFSFNSADFFNLILKRFANYFNCEVKSFTEEQISGVKSIEKYDLSEWTFKK